MDINNIITAITPILVTILTGAVTYIVTKVTQYLEVKLGNENYNKVKNYAVDAWNIVEEYFRLYPEAKVSIKDKVNMFTLELRKNVPSITDVEIESLRQAIAGEINKGKAATVKK